MRQLSIIFVTMNRSVSLIEAIKSCFESDLPNDTQFIIVDNGSLDKTEEMVKDLFSNSPFDLVYQKMETNVGISKGRNIGKDLSDSKYCYYMDDDAIISDESRPFFFGTALRMLEADETIATLTTRVFDKTLNMWRESKKSKFYTVEKPEVFVFHGNNYFIRSSIPDLDYVDTIKYAYEDLFLSICAIAKGYYNALAENLFIVHKPTTNKWIKGSKSLEEIYIKANASQLAIRKLLFPKRYTVLISFAFLARCFKTFKLNFSDYLKSYKLYRSIVKNQSFTKIQTKTVRDMQKKFGFFKVL